MISFALCVKLRKKLSSMLFGVVRRHKMCGVVAQSFFKKGALGGKILWKCLPVYMIIVSGRIWLCGQL
jgi:hypothetical protein